MSSRPPPNPSTYHRNDQLDTPPMAETQLPQAAPIALPPYRGHPFEVRQLESGAQLPLTSLDLPRYASLLPRQPSQHQSSPPPHSQYPPIGARHRPQPESGSAAPLGPLLSHLPQAQRTEDSRSPTSPVFFQNQVDKGEDRARSRPGQTPLQRHEGEYHSPSSTTRHEPGSLDISLRGHSHTPRTAKSPTASSVPAPQESIFSSRYGTYEIRVRQQPLAARACGFGERDRRAIDPPPIVQLTVKQARRGSTEAADLRYPFNVVHCTLWNEDGSADETELLSLDRRVTRRLMGTLVSSPFVGRDDEDQEGCFFCFPDLSCRTPGRFRLRFVLMRIEANEVEPGGFAPILTHVMSDAFVVFTAKDFPGMRASTSLTKLLKSQGCSISVKKGNERASKRTAEAGSGQEESDEDEGSKRRHKRKRNK